MIRATLVLCAAIFLTLTIAGRDTGQLRAGLAEAETRTRTVTYRYIPLPETRVTPVRMAGN